MHRSLGNTHHANFPPVPGPAWALLGLILPPGHTAGCELLVLERKSHISGVARPACHTHKCAPSSTQAGEQTETDHSNRAEGVKMPMFSRVAADTEPLAQSSSAGTPSLGAGGGISGCFPVPRAEQSRAEQRRGGSSVPSTPGLRHCQKPVRSDVLRAIPASLHQQVRATRAAVLHGLGRGGRGD